jgi:hypothetical protein
LGVRSETQIQMGKKIRLTLPTGQVRAIDVQPNTKASDVMSSVDVSGFLIVAADGRLIYPDEDLHLAVEEGQNLHMYPAETGGKGGVGVAPGVDDPDFWRLVVKYQLIYSFAGLVVGLAFVVAGMVLFFHGVTGSTGWIAESFGAKSTLTDAPPGVVLFVASFLVVATTGFRVRSSKR